VAEETAGEALGSFPDRYLGASWATTRFIVNLQIAAFGLVDQRPTIQARCFALDLG